MCQHFQGHFGGRRRFVRSLNSGRPAYSPTTAYPLFHISFQYNTSNSIHIQRHRVRPEPGPNTQNKPRELDPKGSHGLLCAHLRQNCRESVGGPGLRAFTCSVSNQECETLGHANLPLSAYLMALRGLRSIATDLRPHQCASE